MTEFVRTQQQNVVLAKLWKHRFFFFFFLIRFFKHRSVVIWIILSISTCAFLIILGVRNISKSLNFYSTRNHLTRKACSTKLHCEGMWNLATTINEAKVHWYIPQHSTEKHSQKWHFWCYLFTLTYRILNFWTIGFLEISLESNSHGELEPYVSPLFHTRIRTF